MKNAQRSPVIFFNCINASTYIVNKQPVGLAAQNPKWWTTKHSVKQYTSPDTISVVNQY